MTRKAQEQSGGDRSTNLQAGRDVHLHGLTLDDARQVALDVFKANAIELAGVAQAVAVSRAEEITNEFLDKLNATQPEQIEALADPDMQSVLFDAQKEYARSGEEDLKQALVDLLAARAEQTDRDLRTLALNEAIASAPKLTERQRRAAAWVFYLRYTRDMGSGDPDAFYTRLAEVVDALGVDVPERHADYQHMEYVGVGSVSISSVSLGGAIYSGSEGLFTKGFDESSVDQDLFARMRQADFLLQCLRDPNTVQVNHLALQNLPEQLEQLGLGSDLDAIRELMTGNRMSDDEIAAEASARVPALASLHMVWDSETSSIRNFTLTSVGIALGHAYWSRLTGRSSPLSIWL